MRKETKKEGNNKKDILDEIFVDKHKEKLTSKELIKEYFSDELDIANIKLIVKRAKEEEVEKINKQLEKDFKKLNNLLDKSHADIIEKLDRADKILKDLKGE